LFPVVNGWDGSKSADRGTENGVSERSCGPVGASAAELLEIARTSARIVDARHQDGREHPPGYDQVLGRRER